MDKKILEASRPRVSIKDFSIEEIVSFLKEALLKHENVRDAYLFGSLAMNQEDAWSDIDVLIVADVEDPFIERPRAFFELLDLGVPVDILVYTPEEFEALRKNQRGFWKSFNDTHVKIL